VQAFKDLRKEHPAFKIVFLYCSQSQLEGRQDYGFHPLKSACGSISAAIFKECEIIVNLFGELCADFMDDLIFIDSSHPKPRGIQTVKAALDRGLKQGSAGSNFSDPHLKDLRAQLCTRGWNQMQATLSQVREMVAIINREFKARGHGVVKTRLNCLLLGESGTGKERIAKILHSDSEEGTTAKPQVVIDCTAIPHGLIESELFGCVKGAFTGATNRKCQVESADGGVIFLDEIGLVDKSSQAKLLRLIEERQYRKVGEDVCSSEHRALALLATNCRRFGPVRDAKMGDLKNEHFGAS
jgi:transcriptional regulator with AAA-type ATPase domain